jgi:excisionase family DNA binding protein
MTKPVAGLPDAETALQRLRRRLFATTTETAVVLGCDARTVRRAIEAGEIPAVRAGSTYRIPVAWLRAQIRAGANEGETTQAV